MAAPQTVITTILLFLNCGLFVTSGKSINQYPFLVQVTQRNTFICSGAILREDIVLAAAHCVCDPKNIGIIAGRTSLISKFESPQVRKVSRIIPHRSYKCGPQRCFENDIAILVLDKDLKFNAKVNAIPLSQESSSLALVYRDAIVIGWGNTRASTELLAANMTILSDLDCYELSQAAFDLDDNGICAVDLLASGMGTCWGQTGSILIMENEDSPFRYSLLGIASTIFGNKKRCNNEFPSIFASVLHQQDFIGEYVGYYTPTETFTQSTTTMGYTSGDWIMIT